MKLRVHTTPKDDEILRKVSEPVDPSIIQSSDFQEFLDGMIEAMKLDDGVGIAAPQVGKNIRVIIVDTGRGPRVYINPEIVEKSNKMIDSTEGCLSVPRKYGTVTRYKKVKINALDRNGKPAHIKKGEFLSTVFQHEIDHLDGILFIDKAEKVFEE